MQLILYKTFDIESPITINKIDDNLYNEIPLFNQIKYLLNIIKDHKELLLTKKGFLPVKIVADIYNQKFIKDYAIEIGITKLYKESDVNTINLTRILIELSPFVKKRNNKLSLTKKGTHAFYNNNILFNNFFEIFLTQFNWGYYDGYNNEEIGQLGFGFTLILLNKYGNQFRPVDFYANKYLKAFNFENDYTNEQLYFADNPKKAYNLRSFDRCLNYFGLIETQEKYGESIAIKRSKLFENLFKIRGNV